MFLFVVSAFLLLAWRSEINADNIKENSTVLLEREQFSQCQERNANTMRSNTLYEGLISIEKKNPFAEQSRQAAATIQRRIELYSDNMLVPVDCGGRP